MLFVLLPSLTRVAIRFNQAKPYLKFFNIVVLLVLSCSNAAVSLPTAFRHPDIDFLSVTSLIVHFVPGLIRRSMGDFPRRFSASREQEPALIFGLGMSNNGTGLVLASASLAGHPLVTLPVIFCDRRSRRSRPIPGGGMRGADDRCNLRGVPDGRPQRRLSGKRRTTQERA